MFRELVRLAEQDRFGMQYWAYTHVEGKLIVWRLDGHIVGELRDDVQGEEVHAGIFITAGSDMNIGRMSQVYMLHLAH